MKIGCTKCDREGIKSIGLAMRVKRDKMGWNYAAYAIWSEQEQAYCIKPELIDQPTPRLYCYSSGHHHPIPFREYVRDNQYIRASDTRRMMSLL